MPIEYHNQQVISAYIDLKNLLQREVLTRHKGSTHKKSINGKDYWYESYRLGNQTKTRFLGRDDHKLREIIAERKAEEADVKALNRRMAQLGQILRSSGFTALDQKNGSILSALSKAGFFRLGGVLVGTHAFRTYEGELGIKLASEQATMNTGDIDIAAFERLTLGIADIERVSNSAQELLSELKFKEVPPMPNAGVWKWTQGRDETEVEFLTPKFGSEDTTKYLVSLDVSAKGIEQLNFLLRDPIEAVANYRGGILLRVPAPARYAIHKLIVACRRQKDSGNTLKIRKDRLQAELLIDVLSQDRPTELADAYAEALNEGPKWREQIETTLETMPKSKTILDNTIRDYGA